MAAPKYIPVHLHRTGEKTWACGLPRFRDVATGDPKQVTCPDCRALIAPAIPAPAVPAPPALKAAAGH